MSDGAKATTSAGPSLPEIRPSFGGGRSFIGRRPRPGESWGDFVARVQAEPTFREAFPRADMRIQALREAWVGWLREAHDPSSACVVIRVPDGLAEQFPPERAEHDDSPAHVTVCYLGPLDDDAFARAVEAVREVADSLDPWPISLEDYGEFENGKGHTIAHMIPRAEGGPEVGQVAALIEKGLIERDIVPKVHAGPFRPHATLAYVEEGARYDGPRPQGRWIVEAFEVWRGTEAITLPLAGEPGTSATVFGATNGYHAPTPDDEADAVPLFEGWTARAPRWSRGPERLGEAIRLFGSPAGKSHIAAKLLPMFPPHRVYTEACAGGAAMFWTKESAPVSVLGDVDADIVFMFEACRDLSDADIEALRGLDWKGSRKLHESLRAEKRAMREAPERDDRLRRFYREVYLRRFGFKAHPGSFHPGQEGVTAHTPAKLERLRAKLRGAIVKRQDAAATVAEFDGPDAFHFLDPPWPGFRQGVRESVYDPRPLMETLARAAGRYLVVYQGDGFDPLAEMDARAVVSRPRWLTKNTDKGGGVFGALGYKLISNYRPGDDPDEIEEAVRVAMWALRKAP